MEVARLVRTGLLVGLVGLAIHLTSSVVSPIVPLFILGLLYFLTQIPGGPGPERTAPLHDEQALGSGLSFGVAAVQGGRPYMEDMYQVVTFNGGDGAAAGAGGSSGAAGNNTCVASAAADKLGLLNFFAVYDGHGGKLAAQYVHKNLVPLIVSALEQQTEPSEPNGAQTDGAAAEAVLGRALSQGFLQADDAFIRVRKAAVQHAPRCRPLPAWKHRARTRRLTRDRRRAAPRAPHFSPSPLQGAAKLGLSDGSTAIAALLQRDGTLTVANVGDSRCALVRKDGSCVPLSSDHKPNRPDERARICAAGGWVVHQGCWRVAGDLAVSRAFGDRHLKRYGVCAEPELSRYVLGPLDAYLLLASDGLWYAGDARAPPRPERCAAGALTPRPSPPPPPSLPALACAGTW